TAGSPCQIAKLILKFILFKRNMDDDYSTKCSHLERKTFLTVLAMYVYLYIYLKRRSFLVLVHTLVSPDSLATALFTLKAQAFTKERNVILRTLTFKIVQRIFFIPCSKYHLEQDDTKNPEPHMEVPA
ncbi:hypothetical protein E2320_009664, partial [Naja naja]